MMASLGVKGWGRGSGCLIPHLPAKARKPLSHASMQQESWHTARAPARPQGPHLLREVDVAVPGALVLQHILEDAVHIRHLRGAKEE